MNPHVKNRFVSFFKLCLLELIYLFSLVQIRRCGSLCLVAMCEHYPISRHVKLVEFLLEKVSKEPASEDFKHGILLCFLGIVKMKRAFIDNTDPMKKASLRILKFCLDNIDSKNHTIASSSIDVINQFLIDYPTCDFLWTSSYCEMWGIKHIQYYYCIVLIYPMNYLLYL